MYYYDPNDRRPRRWALLGTALYVLLFAAAFALVSFDFTPPAHPEAELYIDLTDAPAPAVSRTVPNAGEQRRPETPAAVERTAQTAGEEPETRTPNPRALFRMDRSGKDEPADAGNPRAREGEERSAGRGAGLDPDGIDRLDRGLQGRGLVGDLPRPDYPGTKSGKVVIRVTVDAAGTVTGASFEPKGSTASDAELVAAAIAAARKARFTESRATVQGGTITYVFRME